MQKKKKTHSLGKIKIERIRRHERSALIHTYVQYSRAVSIGENAARVRAIVEGLEGRSRSLIDGGTTTRLLSIQTHAIGSRQQ